MAFNVQTKNIDWDQVFEVMPGILQFLNIIELCTVARVSKNWHEAVLLEKAKRYYIQQTSFSYPEPMKLSMLKVKPYLTLLIKDVDSSLEFSDIVQQYTPIWGPKLIAMKVDKCLTTQDVGRMDWRLQTRSRARLFHGIFFPSLEQRARVQVVWEPCTPTPMNFYARLHLFIEELGLMENNRLKATLLFFTQSRKGFELADELSANSLNAQNDTMWTYMTHEMPIKIMNFNENCLFNRSIVAIKITGPSVSSWSAEIDSRLSRYKFEAKLLELKGRVQRKRHCTGLFYSPASNAYGNSYKITKNVKRIFPGIPFVGFFNSKKWSYDSSCFNEPYDQFYSRMNNMSIIIITYD